MTDTTDALELLRSQHDEVLELVDRIQACDEPERKLELFTSLADQLAAHATIEERIFYPSVLSDQTADMLCEATEEHLAAKRVLADLIELDVMDDHWDAKLTVLQEELRHHARDEEEGKLFPLLEKLLSADQRAGLGNELLAMFEELMTGEPRMLVPSETFEAAHLEAFY